MITFTGLCVDARYTAEHLYYKAIKGNGFRNDKYGNALIKYGGEWYEVDLKTVSICEVDSNGNVKDFKRE